MTTLKTMVTDWIRVKTQAGDPATPATGFGAFYDKGKAPYYVNSDGTVISLVPGASVTDGWYAATNTWSYSAADAPTFVISVNADVTGQIGVGMKIKLTQTTVKYFIVTAVGAYGGGVTLVTVYGGTDYTLISAAISTPYYSLSHAPLGFPISPVKWTVEVKDTNLRSQNTPSAATYYNIGTTTISLPIGAWLLGYKVIGQVNDANLSSNWDMYITLSTANNSASDADYTVRSVVVGSTNGQTSSIFIDKHILVASKTSYYLNAKTTDANLDTIYFRGDLGTTILRAVCAYL